MSFLNDDIPWGSPVVPSIPLPPFTSTAEHDRYVRMLQLHLALLDGGSPTLPTIALSRALERPRNRQDAEFTPWLTPLELSVSLTAWFPAPWTPALLAQTLVRSHRDSPTLAGISWRWLNDPDFSAVPHDGGGWVVTRSERGSSETEALKGDRDLVVLWIAMFREKYAFPLAFRYDDDDLDALSPASLAILEADAKDAAYPYRASWRAERSAALAVACSPGDLA